jgi:hypothetical protein
MSALVIGPKEKEALAALKAKAEKEIVHLPSVHMQIQQPDGLEAHMQRLNEHTISIPLNYTVTFTVEDGVNGDKKCRHMSMATSTPGKVPHMESVKMVAAELGYTKIDTMEEWGMWLEALDSGQQAVNLVQFL